MIYYLITVTRLIIYQAKFYTIEELSLLEQFYACEVISISRFWLWLIIINNDLKMRRDKKDDESSVSNPYENLDKCTIVQEVFLGTY